MNCCIECFKDVHIRDTIQKQNIRGNCDFCSAKNVFKFDISATPNPIADMIIGLIQIYSVSDLPVSKPLKESLRDDWDIFCAGVEVIQALVAKLCESSYAADDEVFQKNVIIPELIDEEYLNEFGVVKGLSWNKFSDSIKYENRFHSGMFNADAFASFLSILADTCPADSILYRARIAQNETGFTIHEMSAPPKGKRSAGRINPEGIGMLYLALDKKTVLSEVRANTFDYVTIGDFRLKHDLGIVNLSGIERTSPFLYGGDLGKYAANRKVLQEIALEVAKPLRRSDSPLEYLPTQFISEFIKSQGYNGVKYASTLCDGGYNLAVFSEDSFECINVHTVEVDKITYYTSPEV